MEYRFKQDTLANWYRENYPSDTVDIDWLDNITWDDFANSVSEQSGVLCDWCDSVVRERIFSEASKRLGIDYGVLYDLWIDDKL